MSIGAVLLGNDFQALGVVRSLVEHNIPMVLIKFEPGICRYSRYVKRRIVDKSLLNDAVFADRLIHFAKKEKLKGWVLYPNNDEIVKLLSLNRKKLQGWYLNPVLGWEVTEKYYYKNKTYDIAESISIPIPKRYKGNAIHDYMKQNMRFPIVLKPTYKEKYYSITRRKALKVDNLFEFEKEYNEMSNIIDHSEIVVQEYVEGGTKNLYSYACFFDGKDIVSGMAARRLRQHPMDFGHATTYAVPVNVPELKKLAARILKEIGFYGIAEVEFMWDERDQVFKFIEINGRVWGWHTLARATGVNTPYIQFQHITGIDVQVQKPDLNVKWVRILTDIPTVIKELLGRRMTVKTYIQSLHGKKEFAVLSLRDPLPFLIELLLMPYLWWKRGF